MIFMKPILVSPWERPVLYEHKWPTGNLSKKSHFFERFDGLGLWCWYECFMGQAGRQDRRAARPALHRIGVAREGGRSDIRNARVDPTDRMAAMNLTQEAPDELIPTRDSLLIRLKNWDDQEGWKEFFDTYWKLIYGAAIKAGLSDAEAREVVQETVLTVAKNIKEFKTGSEHGSFKAWLLKTTRWRIINQFKKRRPDQLHREHRAPDDTRETATLERIADPNGIEFETVWDREWEENLMDVALKRVKARVNPKHYQIFYLNVIKRMPPREVAESLEVGVGMVYLTKLRLSRMVKKIYERLKVEAA